MSRGILVFPKFCEIVRFFLEKQANQTKKSKISKKSKKNVDITKIIYYNITCEFMIQHLSGVTDCVYGRRDKPMAEIRLKDNESLDNALKRFKRQCAKAGVLSEIRKREHYVKPSVKRKKKSEEARKRKFK